MSDIFKVDAIYYDIFGDIWKRWPALIVVLPRKLKMRFGICNGKEDKFLTGSIPGVI